VPATLHTRLDSWKAIADYLDRDVTTAMRWARDCGLPVHRVPHPGSKRQAVFAYQDELEAWLNSGSHSAVELGAGDANNLGTGLAPGEQRQSPGPSPRDSARQAILQRSGVKVWGLAAGLLAVSLGLLAWGALRRSAAVPTSFEFHRDGLTVFDAKGRELWRRTFELPIDESYYHARWMTMPKPVFAALEDINQDRKPEMLFVVAAGIPQEERISCYLVCFDTHGRILWKYRPVRAMRFGGQDFLPPFTVDFLHVADVPEGGLRPVWVVARHVPWVPSAVVELDPEGRQMAEYWHPGHILTIAEATLAGRHVLLAGATHNGTFSASLSVLDYDHPGGSAPATEQPYRCENCSPGAPLGYLLFPRGSISRVLNSRPAVLEIWIRDRGSMEIMVEEGEPANQMPARVSYKFDGNLRLQSAEMTDSYVLAYGRLLERGVFKQPLDCARENASFRAVRYWDGQRFTTQWTPLAISRQSTADSQQPKPEGRK
jgi:hypothetical protein